MGADNVDVFQRLVFSVPSLGVQLPALAGLSVVYSLVAYAAFTRSIFASLLPEPSGAIPVAVLLFLLPFLFAGELFHRVLAEYPRSWSFFLALINQLVLFVYALVLSGANDVGNAWSIIWLLFITIYLTNILALVVSTGIHRYKRILLVSLAEPAALIAAFYAFAGGTLGFSTYRHVFAFASLGIAAAFLVSVLALVDYLIRSNTDVSAFALTSGLLRNDRESLDLGVEAEPAVETLAIDNGNRLTLAAPWVHPGPLGGFGGGQLSGNVIEALNDGRDEHGFFLHVPCTHKEDLSNPTDAEKILDAVGDPAGVGRASRLVHEDYGEIEFYGRRFGDKQVVFLHSEGIDDYDTGVFVRDVDGSELLLVDLHKHDIQDGPTKEVQYGSSEADRLKRHFDDFREKLAAEPLREYAAGFAVERTDQDMIAIVESVDGQDVLTIGIDTNGVTPDIREMEARYGEEFDEVLVFSTDTHASIYELANMKQSNVEALEAAIERALDDVSPATIGLESRRTAPLKLLKNDYNGLVFSVNILIRLTVIALVVLYALLVLWLFF
jgi:putative membrane protein